MSTLDPIWFYCSVSEVEYLKAVENGKTVGREFADLPLTLLLHDGKEHAEKGRFVFIDRAVNAKTGTLRIRAEFPNPAKTLRPGMFARVRVDIGTRKECLQVPERALLEIQGKAFLWSVDAENKCHMQRVKLGEKHGSSQIILEGVKVGEHIIVEGIQKARDGAPVTAMTAAQLAAAKAAHKLEAQPAH
jgi:membrane fusion protein (multidrug efflux system)